MGDIETTVKPLHWILSLHLKYWGRLDGKGGNWHFIGNMQMATIISQWYPIAEPPQNLQLFCLFCYRRVMIETAPNVIILIVQGLPCKI